MVESRISMRASSWSTPVSLLDFVKKKKSNFQHRRKSHLKIVLDSNYYILIVQLSQKDPIILKFRTQSNFRKNLTALLLKFLIRHVCPSKRKLARTIEDGHISEDRTTFARDVVLDHFWSIESRQLRRKLALSHASSLSLSLFTRATRSRCFDFRQSTTWKATSTCRNPRSFRPRNERWSRALVPVSFYLLSLERIYRLPIKRLRLMGHR